MLDSPAARDAAVSNEPNDVAIISTDALVAAEPPVSAAAATIDAAAATIDLLPHATPLPQADGDADADAALALALEPYAGVRFSGMFRACVPALQALHNACFPIVYSDSFYEQLVAGDEYSTILALSEADGSVVGFATGRVESDAAASVVCRARRRSGYISTFGVAPSHRGRGLGSVLLKNLCTFFAISLCVDECTLDVKVDNAAAIAMYTKHGFTVRQRLADHYYIDGAYWDAFHMAKPLPDARKRAPRQFCVLL